MKLKGLDQASIMNSICESSHNSGLFVPPKKECTDCGRQTGAGALDTCECGKANFIISCSPFEFKFDEEE